MDGSLPQDDTWTVAGRRFSSRLIVGTGRYKDLEETGAAIAASGAEIVTVAVRRVNLSDPKALADAAGLRRSRRNTRICRIPPVAIPPRRRCARCGWRARRAGGTW